MKASAQVIVIGRGLCIWFLRKPGRPLALDSTPSTFGYELLTNDIDRIKDSTAFADNRFAVLENRWRQLRHPQPVQICPRRQPTGRPKLWGFSLGGGVGLMPVPWMIEGEGDRDETVLDVGRIRVVDYVRRCAAQGHRDRSEPLLHRSSERGAARRPAPPDYANV